MGYIAPNRPGLVLAALFGGWHFLWSLLVAFGVAQPLIDFLFWIHFIKPVYIIEPFAQGGDPRAHHRPDRLCHRLRLCRTMEPNSSLT